MRQSFCGRHIGRDLMIPLYILSAQTRNEKKHTHTHNILYYTVVCLFSFHFFSRTLCTAVPFLQARTRIEKQLSYFFSITCVSGTRFSMLDWVRVTGLSCTKCGMIALTTWVWYIYDRDTGQLIRCVEGPCGLPLLLDVNYSV